MSLEDDLYQYLLEQPSVIDAVGTYRGNAKIYPEIAEQGAELPYVVFTFPEEERPTTLGLDNNHIRRTEMLIDCWAFSQEDADACLRVFRGALVNHRGQFGGTFIPAILETGKAGQLVVPEDGTDAEIYGARLTLRVWSEE